MKRWEYKIDTWNGKIPLNEDDLLARRRDIENWMNGYGAQGWEIISVTPSVFSDTEWMACTFKREITP